MKTDSIIFDLDGTLWDATEGICEAWKIVLNRYPEIGRTVTTEELGKNMGLTIDEIGRRLFPELDENFQLKLMSECCEEEQSYLGEYGGRLYPKLKETLDKLSEKYKLYIVSNCQDGYIQCFLKAHKLNKYFSDFECWGATGLSKGQNNKIIMERNKIKKAIYAGDTNGDAESARFAEIPFIYARYGFGNVEKYDYAIDSFEEILNLGL